MLMQGLGILNEIWTMGRVCGKGIYAIMKGSLDILGLDRVCVGSFCRKEEFGYQEGI